MNGSVKDYPKTKACYGQAVLYDKVVSDLHGNKIQCSTWHEILMEEIVPSIILPFSTL